MNRPRHCNAAVLAVAAAFSAASTAACADSSPFPPSERWLAPSGGSEQVLVGVALLPVAAVVLVVGSIGEAATASARQ